MAAPDTILILGGTTEARALAARLTGSVTQRVLTSLAGRTTTPEAIAGETRVGGFGGAAGLARYIAEARVVLVVDATHPFAAAISANAVAACGRVGVPCLRLERPAWRPLPDDRWQVVANIPAAARAIPPGARALVTVGRQEIQAFLEREDIHFVARMIEPPGIAIPDRAELLLARPPFTVEDENRLMRERAIDVLVTKNSGGSASVAKLMAARQRALPVIMVERPVKPPVPAAPDVDSMLDLISGALP